MDSSQATSVVFLAVAGTTGMLVLCVVAVLIFIAFYKRNIKAQKLLFAQEVAYKEQLNISNLQTLEDERRRFAQDLHDEIGASLSAIRLYVGSIVSQISDEPLQAKLQQVKQTIDQSMASTRRISHNILPPGLELMGLSMVVNDLVSQLNQSKVLHISILVEPNIPKLHFEKELMLYRVLQELLQNTVKHAQATEVTICFSFNPTHYIIQYKDNGIGVDLSQHKRVGLGLSNIQSRIKMVGGTYTIITAVNEGFEITIDIER